MIRRKKIEYKPNFSIDRDGSYINIGKQLSRFECRSDKAVVTGSIPVLPTSSNKILYNI